MIQNISINKLHPHPDNPRKDLGDLTELAESIKTQGILQNLTVVPWFSEITRVGCDFPEQQEKMGYRIVIGHRRHAASKLAGLTELPCVVVEMTPQEQVATMLLENMQRADLTVYEQAQGFQMMINFGETMNNIAEKTGFSETTIRRRVKLLELDPEKFKESANRNVTLMEYAELEQIENIVLRNKVLDSIGTQNFKYELKKAVEEEQKEKWLTKVISVLETFAEEVTERPSGHRYVKSYYASRDDEVEVPDNAEEEAYFYEISKYGYITLYGEPQETKEDMAEKEKREKERARYNALDEIANRTYGLRRDFIFDISNAKAKKNIGLVIENTIRIMVESYNSVDYEDFANFYDATTPDDGEENIDNLLDEIRSHPEKSLLAATYLSMDGSGEKYFNWNSQYRENEDLDRVYELLEALGYEISDEEKAMRDGTHELFVKDED